jgi:hypothetical protein
VELRRGIAVLVIVGLAGLGLGWAAGSAVSAGSDGAGLETAVDALDESAAAATESAAAATESAAAATESAEPPARSEPLHITLAGDSVMAGLAPAVAAALEGEGSADVEFVLTPSVLRDATVRFSWQRELEAFAPDIVVMFVGIWELGEVAGAEQGAAGFEEWRSVYDRDVLDPWLEMIAASEAEVIWLGAPVVQADDVNLRFLSLNAAYRELEQRWDAVTYLDTSAELVGSDGRFADVIPGPGGEPMRIRQVDGLHLCPDGAVLLTERLLEIISEERPVQVSEGWQDEDWRTLAQEYPAEACPPV